MSRTVLAGAIVAVAITVLGAMIPVVWPEIDRHVAYSISGICFVFILVGTAWQSWSQKQDESEMPDNTDVPKGPTAIYFGKETKDNLTDGNIVIGFDNPITDLGSNNQHLRNKLYRTKEDSRDISEPKPDIPKGTSGTD